jgi:hypothetical protein
MEKPQVLDLLASNEMEKVLDALETQCQSQADLFRDWTNLSARFHRARNQELQRTANIDDLDVVYNQIRDGLIELVERVYAPPAPARKRVGVFFQQWRWPILIVGFSLAVIGFGLLPVREVGFQATLHCSDVRFRIVENWPKTLNFPAKRLDLGLLQQLQGTGWQYSMEESGQPLNVSLDTGKMEVGRLFLKAGEVLGLRIREKDVTLAFDGQASGEIQVQRSTLSGLPRNAVRDFGRGSTAADLLTWIAEPLAELTFQPTNDTGFQVPRLGIEGIEFVKKEEDQTKSAIVDGTLDIAGQEPVVLQNGDFLELSGLSEADVTVKQENGAFTVGLNGKARALARGRKKMHSLKPSLLEYVYHDQWIVFIFSVLASLVSLLWTVLGALGVRRTGTTA